MRNILILGATSVIAHETAKGFAREGAALYLIGRNPEKLSVVRDDLLTRGAVRVEMRAADLADVSRHRELIDTAVATLGGLDAVLIAHGDNGDQQACER